MAKGGIGKLGKLKCMIKRWQAAAGHGRLRPAGGVPATVPRPGDDPRPRGADGAGAPEKVPAGLHPVFVGKSRRRYLIGAHLVDHPLLRVLVQRSGGPPAGEGGGDESGTVVVGCEVVLFEHLLWMLENADPLPESLDELADFYAC